jgi:hypothetical protein
MLRDGVGGGAHDRSEERGADGACDGRGTGARSEEQAAQVGRVATWERGMSERHRVRTRWGEDREQ